MEHHCLPYRRVDKLGAVFAGGKEGQLAGGKEGQLEPSVDCVVVENPIERCR